MWSVARRQLQQLVFETTKAWVGAGGGGWGGGGGGGGGGALGFGIAGEVECFGCVIRRLTTNYLACSSHVPDVHLCKNVT